MSGTQFGSVEHLDCQRIARVQEVQITIDPAFAYADIFANRADHQDLRRGHDDNTAASQVGRLTFQSIDQGAVNTMRTRTILSAAALLTVLLVAACASVDDDPKKDKGIQWPLPCIRTAV
jgi:hypothetical protein